MSKLITLYLLCISIAGISQSHKPDVAFLTRDSLRKAFGPPWKAYVDSSGIHLHFVEVDTVRTPLIAYTKIPGILFIKWGFSVRFDGKCTDHLDDRYRPIKLPTRILCCQYCDQQLFAQKRE